MKQNRGSVLSQSLNVHAGSGQKCRQACLSEMLPRYGRLQH